MLASLPFRQYAWDRPAFRQLYRVDGSPSLEGTSTHAPTHAPTGIALGDCSRAIEALGERPRTVTGPSEATNLRVATASFISALQSRVQSRVRSRALHAGVLFPPPAEGSQPRWVLQNPGSSSRGQEPCVNLRVTGRVVREVVSGRCGSRSERETYHRLVCRRSARRLSLGANRIVCRRSARRLSLGAICTEPSIEAHLSRAVLHCHSFMQSQAGFNLVWKGVA